MRKYLFPGLIALFSVPAPAAVLIGADHADIRYSGRYDLSDPGKPRFDWPGCTIQARFTGPSISVRLTGGNNDFDVFIDGALKGRIALESGKTEYAAARDLPPGEHTLLLAKRTEAYYGVAAFDGLVLADGNALVTLPPPAGARIQFIGDSFTAGYGAEATAVECAELRPWDNGNVAYGPVTARALGAEYSVQAVSGLGMVHNYGDQSPLSAEPMPFFLDRTLAGRDQPRWNPSAWSPHLVVVALGTNDFSTAVKPSQAQYSSAYKDFIGRIRGYHPAAEILCLTYPVDDFQGRYVEALVKEVNAQGDAKVHWANLPALAASELGCHSHPNVAGHRRYSDALVPIARRYLPGTSVAWMPFWARAGGLSRPEAASPLYPVPMGGATGWSDAIGRRGSR